MCKMPKVMCSSRCCHRMQEAWTSKLASLLRMLLEDASSTLPSIVKTAVYAKPLRLDSHHVLGTPSCSVPSTLRNTKSLRAMQMRSMLVIIMPECLRDTLSNSLSYLSYPLHLSVLLVIGVKSRRKFLTRHAHQRRHLLFVSHHHTQTLRKLRMGIHALPGMLGELYWL
jgi:hypothetical protein